MSLQLRCEWGEGAVRSLSAEADVLVIVDVLSFSTCVDEAVTRGARILPYNPSAPGAEEFAKKHEAALAVRRGQRRFTLSPAAYLDVEPGTSVVLRSPNGALATLTASSGVILAGCLRNASAIARAATELGQRILIVPAGERWPDGSLRPCLEDWLGAGAILRQLSGKHSAEARAAIAAFQALTPHIPQAISDSLSGRELIERGYAQDVALAAEVDVSSTVSRFHGEAFI